MRVALVRHRPELDELENFFILSWSFLGKEWIALHLDCPEDRQDPALPSGIFRDAVFTRQIGKRTAVVPLLRRAE